MQCLIQISLFPRGENARAGWAYQGSMFLCEVRTEWYERYQRLLEMSEDFGGIPIDESDPDDES